MIVHDDLLKEAAAAAMLEEIPTDLVEKEIETTTEKLLESSQAIGEISRNVEQVGVLTESLESYVSNFMATVPEGDWNARTARQFQMGMGAILTTAGVTLESSVYCESFEAVGSTQTGDENRAESKKKSEGLVRRMWEALKAVVRTFVGHFKTFLDWFDGSLRTVSKMSRNLEARAKDTKGTSDKVEFDGSPAWASYMQRGSETLTPARAMEMSGQNMRELTALWAEVFSHEAESILSDKNLEEFRELKDKALPNIPQKLLGAWPGGAEVFVEGDTLGTAKLKVKKSDTKPTQGVKVLTTSEVLDISKGLSTLFVDLVAAQKLGRLTYGRLDHINLEVRYDSTDRISADAITKLLNQIIMPYRALSPIALDVAKNAYRHADASLKLMK